MSTTLTAPTMPTATVDRGAMASLLAVPSVRQRCHPISVAAYHRLGETGQVAENTELLRGVVVEKMSKTPRHTFIVELLMQWLLASAPEGHYPRQEQPLTLVDSEPEPDIAVVRGKRSDFASAHPTTAELVIEVAIHSLEIDRAKADLYAQAGVAEYWIVNVADEIVEIHTSPAATGYQTTRRHARGAGELASAGFKTLSVDVEKLFAIGGE